MSRPGGQGQQPMSFKTVPGRNKTQKWQQAKTYNYDGDEWGGYDPYDEYGGYDDPAPAPAPQEQRYASEPPYEQHLNRPPSFDRGMESERRQFSGPAGFAQQERIASPAASSSSGGRPSGDYPQSAVPRPSGDAQQDTRDRNFTNPEQMPPPLNTRISPDRHAFPPRKSSISSSPGGANGPPPVPAPETMPSKSPQTDKPLPFIRPSDIYRRMAEEKERQSMDSSRPSMDSLQRDATSPPAVLSRDSPASSGVARRPSMDPVAEGTERAVLPSATLPSLEEPRPSQETFPRASPDMDYPEAPEYRPLSSLKSPSFGEPESRSKENSPVLPPVSRISGFGTEFLHSSADDPFTTADANAQRPLSPQQHVSSVISRVMNAPIANLASSHSAAFNTCQDTPNTAIGTTHGAPHSDLQHQTSTSSDGYRSMVNTAFDRKDDSSVPPTPISRDNSQATTGSSGRSDTNSTSGISPIMSRVPSAATAQQRQNERDVQVPSIAEEPLGVHTPTQSRPVSGSFQVPRKPSPSHSRVSSAGTGSTVGIVQPGYRRSLEPPSGTSSPARTPGLETNDERRLGSPMAAETVAEEPDVADQAAEMPKAHLEPAEMPASEIDEPKPAPSAPGTALPMIGRGRSGTDYSIREADMAHEVNASPEQGTYSPPVAEDVRNSQQQFLRIHTGTPTTAASPGFARPVSPGLAARGLGIGRTGTPTSMSGSGRNSPAKGRVREMAESYNSIDEASRRNSAASSAGSTWSNFRSSEENLGLNRKGTGLSQVETGVAGEEAIQDDDDGMFQSYGRSQNRSRGDSSASPASDASGAEQRPVLGTQPSFRPDIPGGWTSYAPTPADEEPPFQGTADEQHSTMQPSPLTPRASHLKEQEDTPDLTPTTKKIQLSEGNARGSPAVAQQTNVFSQIKDAGAAIGASLMTGTGLATQARDFGSTEPVQPVEQPEMRSRAPTGEVLSYLRPAFPREESDASMATEGPLSVGSDVPPTPPAKNTPRPPDTTDTAGGHSGVGSLGVPESHAAGAGERPISNYFSGAVAPLRTGYSREGSRDDGALLQSDRPRFSKMLSTDPGADDFESDRLRKEIVRSLDPIRKEDINRENIIQDTNRTQDALDAPQNERRIEQGLAALPATEHGDHQQAMDKADDNAQKPLMLDQRFSWEKTPQKQQASPGFLSPQIREPEILPEILPEMPYERPRSRGLHIMNAEHESSDEEVPTSSQAAPVPDTLSPVSGVVSPLTKSQENVRGMSETADGMQEVEPSPISDHLEAASIDSGPRLPSYYQSDAARSSHMPYQSTPDEEKTLDAANTSPPQQPSSPSTANKRQSGTRIPPFREILAIKNGSDRIQTYNDTRQTFAEMDTGLKDWLSNMLIQHPEHATLNTPSGGFAPPAVGGTVGGRHKHSASVAKLGKGFGNESGERKASVGGAVGGDDLAKTPSKGGHAWAGSAAERIDREKMQQRGKDIMKGAGVLGGKAQAGAKGLFAKGRTRFGTLRRNDSGGGDKAASPAPTPFAPTSSRLSRFSRPSRPNATSGSALKAASDEAAARPIAVTEREPEAIIAVPPAAPPTPFQEESVPPVAASFDEEASMQRQLAAQTNHTELGSSAAVADEPTPTIAAPTPTRVHASGLSSPTTLPQAVPVLPLPQAPVSTISQTNFPFLAHPPSAPVSRSQTPASTRRPLHSRSQTPASVSWAESIIPPSRSQTPASVSFAEPVMPPSRSETPASAISGASGLSRGNSLRRPFTNAIGRLRDRSRSVGTRQSRSNSRPGSLVIKNVSGTADWLMHDGEYALPVHSGAAGGGTLALPSPGSRVEAWNEAGAVIPTAAVQGARSGGGMESAGSERSGTPARLGVLPSPTAEDFDRSGVLGGVLSSDQTQNKEDTHNSKTKDPHEPALEAGSAHIGGIAVTEQSDSDALPREARITDAVPLQQDVPPIVASRSRPVTPKRPQQERKVSDLASLPSQKRVKSISRPQTAESPSLAWVLNDGDGDLYFSTPLASKAHSPVLERFGHVEDKPDDSTSTATAGPPRWSMIQDQETFVGAEESRSLDVNTGITTAAPGAQVVPVPATAVPGSNRTSIVSAEEHNFHDADEQSGKNTAGQATSRRSSVSSIGSPDTVIGNRASMLALQAALQESAAKEQLPVPAGTIEQNPILTTTTDVTTSDAMSESRPMMQRSTSDFMADQQRFMSRAYRGKVAPPENRAGSYARLDVGEDGILSQDRLDVAEGNGGGSVDLTGLSGPPTGTPPFQQHPFFRGSVVSVQPTEYERLRHSQVGVPSAPASTAHSRQVSGDAAEKRRPSRLSAFFRTSSSNQEALNMGPAPPGREAITDDFGLHDLHAVTTETPGPEAVVSAPEEVRQEKRRSGIWEAFRRSSSIHRPSMGIERPSIDVNTTNDRPPATKSAPLEMTQPVSSVQPVPKARGLLKKPPQRAASTATPPTEPKQNKRLSVLGKFFGRSNTSARNSPKSNKLIKSQPPTRTDSHRMGGGLPMMTGQVANYEAYEAMRRQGLNAELAFQAPPADLDDRGIPIPPKRQEEMSSPPPRWFAPDEQPHPGPRTLSLPPPPPIARAMSPPTNEPPAIQIPRQRPNQFRRLHSESFKRGIQQASIPEAFRPVDVSFGRQAAPIGPPSEHQPPVMYRPPRVASPMQQTPTLPLHQPYWGRSVSASGPNRLPSTGPPQRQYSTGSAVSAGYQLSPQVSEQSAYQQASAPQASGPLVHARTGSEGSYIMSHQRMGSLDQELARSPAKEYPDQQTPWPIGLPQQPLQSESRRPSYPGQYQFPAQEPGRSAPPHGYYKPARSPPPPQQPQLRYFPPPETPSNYQQYGPPPQHYRPPQHDDTRPFSPLQQQQQQNFPPHQRQRYYPPSGAEGRPLTYQRTTSGYSGRRDDAAVSEQEIDSIMRGVSYPGQEWSPRA